MHKVLLKLAGVGFAACLAMPTWAQTFVFNNGGSAFATPGNYGSVTLTQDGADVDFSVVLADGFNFVTTGNQNSHSSFSFNASGVSVADIVSIQDATPVAGEYGVWTPAGNSPFGTFGFGVHCLICSNGSRGQQADPLTFTVRNATLSDFYSLSTGGNPNASFAADIIGWSTLTNATATGTVGVTVPAVPEAQTYVLMLAGLGAVGFMARRRRQS
jgi:PEP-CTERM motif